MSSWTTEAVHLGEHHRTAALEVVAELGGPDRFGCVLVSGSLTVGLGHQGSDVDLYLSRVDGAPVENLAYRRRGVMVQVNCVDPEVVDRLAAAVHRTVVTSTDRSRVRLQQSEWKLLLRLANGVPLRVDERFAELLGRIDRAALRTLLITPRAAMVASLQEDVVGAIGSGDLLTAAHASALALQQACSTALLAADDLYDGEKFLYRRLDRSSALNPLLPRIWDLLHTAVEFGDAAEPVLELAVRRCLLANFLVGHVMLAGWDGPLVSLPPFRVADRGPLRSPHFGLMRYQDGFGLVGPESGYEVSPALARLWLALDGRDEAEVRSESAASEGCSGAAVAAALGRLRGVDAVVRAAGAGTTPSPSLPEHALFEIREDGDFARERIVL